MVDFRSSVAASKHERSIWSMLIKQTACLVLWQVFALSRKRHLQAIYQAATPGQCLGQSVNLTTSLYAQQTYFTVD